MTVTSIPPEQALSGYKFPGSAALAAEAYWWHLAALPQAPTRERAACHVQALASAAGQIAAALSGIPRAAPDTHSDPLAWTGLATCLTRLALALRGGCSLMEPEDKAEVSDEDYSEWQNLAQAVGRREFAAAWHPVRDNLLALAAVPGDGGGRRLGGFTVAQVIRAAAAVTGGLW